MSKERLGELEDLFEDISNDMRPPYVGVSLDTIVDVKWLIKYAKEQTERVQELEKLCKQLIGEEWMNDEGLYDSEMMKLEKENQRYKHALEEIVEAKENNYGWEYPEVVDSIATEALEKSDDI